MRFRFEILLVCGVFFGQILGCATAPKPHSSNRHGFFDSRVSVNSENKDETSEQLTSSTGGEGEGEATLEHDSQSGRMTEETAKYFRGKKRRARLYAREVKHGEDELDFQWPLSNVKITSPFGKRGRNFHEGVDLSAKTGTPVYAAQSGKVIYASVKIRGYGRMIVIRHPGKLASIYAHNSKLMVKRGEFVRQGQLIAMTGSSGRSTGPHLHFEVRRDLAALNPLKVLPIHSHSVTHAENTALKIRQASVTALN